MVNGRRNVQRSNKRKREHDAGVVGSSSRAIVPASSSKRQSSAVLSGRLPKRRKIAHSPFSASPSTIARAPVSIGNTVRGFVSRCVDTPNGKIVAGRDFMFTPIGTGTVNTWCLVGGAPLTPAAFADSTLRQYLQMYNKFRFQKLVAHYITSSPTSANGDIMFYYNKNRESVFLNQTSGNLLPFVISDPNTVLGPQWQNASAAFQVSANWKSCDYGIDAVVADYADGDLFLLSKTSTTDSPGYVLFDYIIEFAEPSITPRLLTLPITRILWSQVGMSLSQTTVNNGSFFGVLGGVTNLSGTVTTLPTGTIAGDIFKVILDLTNSTRVSNTQFVVNPMVGGDAFSGQTNTQVFWQDGTTIYATYAGNGEFVFYPNAVSAYSRIGPFLASGGGAVSLVLQFWLSYVGNFAASNINPTF